MPVIYRIIYYTCIDKLIFNIFVRAIDVLPQSQRIILFQLNIILLCFFFNLLGKITEYMTLNINNDVVGIVYTVASYQNFDIPPAMWKFSGCAGYTSNSII
jgi:hypothetical protein